ncbi:unnamed protein product [Adineta steineri]|uniref:Uncharacterized protein n=1 Tax=Adineta steineri TaxID=433720 RepID=A0A814DZM7_9BILA|nr:unnamed protein product [Adineta steineri]
MKFNFDSKTLLHQIPSGIILGLLSVLISQYIHIPLISTKIQFLVCLIILLDILHLLGKVDIDISNLCKRQKFLRKINNTNIQNILQIYLEEHLVFLICLFISLFISRFLLNLIHK